MASRSKPSFHQLATSVGGEACYAAIWEKRDRPEWIGRHGLSGDDYQKAFDQFAQDGFRLVWVSGYAVGAGR